MSKGDWRRPATVTTAEYGENFARIDWEDRERLPSPRTVAVNHALGSITVEYESRPLLADDNRPDCRACDNTRTLDAFPYPEPCAFCAGEDD